MRLKSIIGIVVLLIGICIAMHCAREYNPFSDMGNAKAHVVTPVFGSGVAANNLRIYSTYTIQLVISVSALLDSVYIVVPHNRFGDTMILRAPFADSVYYQRISVFTPQDTAMSIISFRHNGDKPIEKIPVTFLSPLRPSPLIGQQGSVAHFATDSVDDNDVYYVWRFGANSANIRTVFPRFDGMIKGIMDTVGVGALSVTDLRGEHESPSVPFAFSLVDHDAPFINLYGSSLLLVHGDTITMGDSIFSLQAVIVDRGVGAVSSAAINNSKFDNVSNDSIYTRIFSSVTGFTSAQPLKVTISAVDRYGNMALSTYYLVYSQSVPSSQKYQLEFVSPSQSPLITSNTDQIVIARLSRLTCDTSEVNVRLTVNDSLYNAFAPTVGGCVATYWWSVKLSTKVASLRLSALTNMGIEIAAKSTLIQWNGDIISADTIPPQILEATSNNQNLNGLIVKEFALPVRIIAFDEQSGIDSLFINNKQVRALDSIPYVWIDTVPLIHSISGTAITVRARDHAGKVATRTWQVYQNTPPVIYKGLSQTSLVRAGILYVDSILVADAENDQMFIYKKLIPDGMTLDKGVLRWMPTAAQAGKEYILDLEYSDGFGSGPEYITSFQVLTQTAQACTLQVSSLSGSIASGVWAVPSRGPNTLECTILNGHDPLAGPYKVAITQNNGFTFESSESDQMFKALAMSTDSSAQGSIRIVVTDRFNNSDTVSLLINYPSASTLNALAIYCPTGPIGVTLNAPVVSFPLLVRLDESVLDFSKIAQGAIKFTNKNGKVLPFEIERWNVLSRRAEVWVLLDTVVSYDPDQSITMQWPVPIVASSQKVFDASGHRGVWHLSSEDGTLSDVSLNHLNAQNFGTKDTNGIIGKGRYFNGVDTYIQTPDSSLKFANEFTVSAWFKVENSTKASHIFWEGNASCNGWGDQDMPESHEMHMSISQIGAVTYNDVASYIFNYGYNPESHGPTNVVVEVPLYGVNQWHLGSVVMRNASTQPEASFYLDGVLQGVSKGAQAGRSNWNTALRLGRPGTNERYFKGTIDEFTISLNQRNADWIALTYANQSETPRFGMFTKPVISTGVSFKIGDTLTHYPQTDGGNNGLLFGQQMFLPVAASPVSLSVYITAALGKMRLALYAADGPNGVPGTLVVETRENSPSTGWNALVVTNPQVLAAGRYWLYMQQSDGRLSFGASSGASGIRRWCTMKYGSFPQIAPNMDQSSTGSWSLYATFK